MTAGLEFSLTPEVLDEGTPEERAAFGMLSIKANGQSLTEGFDYYLDGFRTGPLVSTYYFAEWLAWNWWRLRWEPRPGASDWNMVHQMNTIGEGYVWPNIEIWSDGQRTFLLSRASSKPDARPFRYVGATPVIVPSTLFERAVDEFMPRVTGRLREGKIAETNLDRLWKDILEERKDPDLAIRRRLEALMGRDPDAIDDNAIDDLLAGRERLGKDAVDEVAAAMARLGSKMRKAEDFEAAAASIGFNAAPRSALTLQSRDQLPRPTEVPAWKLGVVAAALVREQECLKDGKLSDHKLVDMAGAKASLLSTEPQGMSELSFALDDPNGINSSIVLSQRYKVGRRFALARIVGDQLINCSGALHPVTPVYTYRQKAQRSFAAELLAPFDAVEDFMRGDYSEDRQQDAAEYFDVSTWVINSLLKNHGKIERDESDIDRSIAA